MIDKLPGEYYLPGCFEVTITDRHVTVYYLSSSSVIHHIGVYNPETKVYRVQLPVKVAAENSIAAPFNVRVHEDERTLITTDWGQQNNTYD